MGYAATGRRARPSTLMVTAWALATLVLATVASAALGDAGVAPVDFQRALPVVLLGEALIYLIVLGGGLVPGPILLLTFVLAFVFRALIATLTTELAPPGRIDNLLAAAEYYYASCWPAAVAQIGLIAVLLRLVRRAVGRPRRMRRPARRAVVRTGDEILARREQLLSALTEAPDVPPASATIIEEQQLGDLGDIAEAPSEEPAGLLSLDQPLPFEAETPPLAPEPGPAQAPAEPTDEQTQAAADVPADTGEDTETFEPVRAESEAAAETAREPEEPAQPPPVAGSAEAAEADAVLPDQTLQQMVDAVVSQAGGEAEGTQIRVWRTAEQRTVLAAAPAGVRAAELSPQAERLIRAHLALCAEVGAQPTDLQIGSATGGGYAVRVMDEAGTFTLLLASAGEQAAARLELMARAVVDPLLRLGGPPVGGAAQPRTPEPPSPGTLQEDAALSRQLSEASVRVRSRLPKHWRAHRGKQGGVIALAAPPGVASEGAAHALAECAGAAQAVASALEVGVLSWFAVSGSSAGVVACCAALGSDAALVAALSSPALGVGEALWELRQLTQAVQVPGS